MKVKFVITFIAIILSSTWSYSQNPALTNGLAGNKDTALSTDSLLQTYSIDDLLELQEYYKNETERLLIEKDELRAKGIRDTEAFIEDHPNSRILDRLIVRLAELYYEQAILDYEVTNDEYHRLLALYDKGEIEQLPEEPHKDYGEPLRLYQRIIDEFPESNLLDDALYNKGFLLEDLGQREQAFEAFQKLIEEFPESRYVPDALMRMAEHYFNPPVNDIDKAIGLYQQVLNYKESSIYDAALYRLGWAYYKLNDYPSAISYFTMLADDIEHAKEIDPEYQYHFPAVRDEAIEYIGISFLDYGGPEKAAEYFRELGGREYGFDVLRKIGDVYLEVKEEYDQAINAYQLTLTMYPNSPKAPEIQAKMAEAYRKMNDERMSYVRRSELFRTYRPGTDWWENVEEPEARKEALDLAERAMRDNIQLLLRRAKETDDQNLYFQAVNDSRDYLSTFSENSNAALIHWNMALTLDAKLALHDQAFDEYIKISNLYWNTRFQKQAAENAIAIADDVLRTDSLSSPRTVLPLTIGEIREGLSSRDSLRQRLHLQRDALTEDQKRLVFALDNYVKLFPHEPETAKILAKAGALYYEHHQFKEALKYFRTLVKHFPGSPEIDHARYIIMESYFGKSDYESAELVARRLRDMSPEYAAKANRRLAESIFLQAKTYADSLEHLRAAQEYRRMVAQAPNVEFADLALYNSALEYEQAKEYRRAVDSYSQLLSEYPKSEHSLNALNNLAFDYRELSDFHNAALVYEKLAQLQPDEEMAQVALYNASVSFVQAEEWMRAIKVNTKFVERFPNAEDADELLFNNANYYLKLGDLGSANNIYAAFAEKFPDSPRVVEAFYHRGKYLKENNLINEAKEEFEKAVRKNNEFKDRGIDSNDFFAAEALYELTESKYNEYKNIEFKLPPAVMSENKVKKKQLLLDLVDSYTKLAGYGTVRLYEATYKIGRVYEDFAQTWALQDIPAMDENRRIVAQKEINNTAAELYERAVEAYKNGVKVLSRFAEAYSQSITPDTVAATSGKLVPLDTTLIAAEKWINKCQSKISETLYHIAEINFESVEQFLNAPSPPGMKKLEEIVYRYQLLVKAVDPTLKEIIAAHTRNINEGAELNLDNQWIELSKNKIVTMSNMVPNEYKNLGIEALTGYSEIVGPYENLIESGDESAFELADQMSNFIEISSNYMLASAKGYKQSIENARSLNIQSDEIAAAEENLMRSIYEYAALADSFSIQADAKRRYYENLFKQTERIDYEDALFTFEENHFSLRDAVQKILMFGYETYEELAIENPWSQKVKLALVQSNPEEYGEMLGMASETKLIPSNSTWLVSADFYSGWNEVDFNDSLWTPAKEIGPSTKFAESTSKKIWIQMDQRSFPGTDSTKFDIAAPSEDTLSSANLTQFPEGQNKVYIRKAFEITGLPVSGLIQLNLDGSYNLFLNGQFVAVYDYDSSQEPSTRIHDLSKFLQSGKNVLSLEVQDSNDLIGSLEAVLEVKNLPDWSNIEEPLEEDLDHNIEEESKIDEK
ncbi:MAG: tetratricopeptide repeat protein [bacterium]